MKHYTMKTLYAIVIAIITWANLTSAQEQYVLDSFNTPPPSSYVGYAPHPVLIQEGYCIYYEQAHVALSFTRVSSENPTNKGLLLEYGLPPYFSWGNWLSIRREFASPLDLQGANGLELHVKIISSSGAKLRITLSDIADDGRSGDEMWWADINPKILRTETSKWLKIRIPFKNFYLSWGAGTRHNDRQMNVSKVVAFEVNIISRPQEYARGTVLVDSISTYKE